MMHIELLNYDILSFILCTFLWYIFSPFYISMKSKIVIELWQIHNYANIQAMANMVVETFQHELMETKKLETKQRKTRTLHTPKIINFFAII